MIGVNILSVEEVAVAHAYNWTVFWIFFGIVFVIFTIGGIAATMRSYDWSDFAACVIIGCMLGGFMGILTGSVFEIPTEYASQYKVTISDEVSMNDFLAKYEIIDQEGKIYTVREREISKDE